MEVRGAIRVRTGHSLKRSPGRVSDISPLSSVAASAFAVPVYTPPALIHRTMTYLSQYLPFPPSGPSTSGPSTSGTATPRATAARSSLPPPHTHLVVTDTLNSPAHFVLYHLVSAAVVLKRPVVWVDIRGEGRASLESVLRRLVSREVQRVQRRR
jgi:hypothetical protein